MTTLSLSEHWQQLGIALEADNATSEVLETLLIKERQALEERDYDSFEKLLEEKDQLLKRLQINALNRTQFLHQSGFVNAAQLLEQAKAEAPIVADLWQKLEKQWLVCQELNRINEQIVKRTEIVVRRSLDILRGQSNNTKVYGANGVAKTLSYGNSLSSA